MKNKYSNKSILSPSAKKVSLIFVGLALLLGILELSNVTHFIHTQPAQSGVIPLITKNTKTSLVISTDTTSQKNNSTPNSSSPKGDTSYTQQATGSAQSVALQRPSGSFVSNHFPNLSGAPAPSSEQSVCNTTPGATCTITFTNVDGIVKSLPVQTTNGDGSTFWSWDVSKAGFTSGDWKINVTADLGNQHEESTDLLLLKVGS